jgi:hypothetical protein
MLKILLGIVSSKGHLLLILIAIIDAYCSSSTIVKGGQCAVFEKV